MADESTPLNVMHVISGEERAYIGPGGNTSAVAPSDTVLSGRLIEKRENQLEKARDNDWTVADVPDDGKYHPYGKRCPVCSR